ncbi:DNA adenine methylase [uncultured Arthrobacter sp.]|uniref:DNA adenine methylase n=1 Tax=uncultured Arthrobacter sp. TaxID=114050 RepID=UPI0032175B67
MNFVKSPLNYTGNKFKLLDKLAPLLGTDHRVVDLFGGGGTVAANVGVVTHYNEYSPQIAELVKWLAISPDPEGSIDALIAEYQLSKTNAEGFLALRTRYNSGDRTPAILYALIAHAFNFQVRFNQSGGYNMPFGRDKSTFNPRMRANLAGFRENAKRIKSFSSTDFSDVAVSEGDLLYCDPPYLVTTASYNEAGGWAEKDEMRLLEYLDELDLPWALSNVMEHQGQSNSLLKKFGEKYAVQHLDMDYSNASYQKKDRTSRSDEVIVTNFTRAALAEAIAA